MVLLIPQVSSIWRCYFLQSVFMWFHQLFVCSLLWSVCFFSQHRLQTGQGVEYSEDWLQFSSEQLLYLTEKSFQISTAMIFSSSSVALPFDLNWQFFHVLFIIFLHVRRNYFSNLICTSQPLFCASQFSSPCKVPLTFHVTCEMSSEKATSHQYRGISNNDTFIH